jgi:hypothetical protein
MTHLWGHFTAWRDCLRSWIGLLMTDLDLNKRRACFYFYFLDVPPSLYWLNNVSCLFLSSLLITSGVWLCTDKSGLACCLYCTKIGWRSICHFPPALAYSLHSPSANGKQVPIPEDISQTLRTNKKQETWSKCTPLTLLSQCKLALTARNTLFALKNHCNT